MNQSFKLNQMLTLFKKKSEKDIAIKEQYKKLDSEERPTVRLSILQTIKLLRED